MKKEKTTQDDNVLLSNESRDTSTLDVDIVDDSVKKQSFVKLLFSGKLPRSFPLIIGNEFCERFCFYGMRAILTLYVKEFLGRSNTTATNVYHIFTLIAYFMPLVGGIIADSWLGKFKTIVYLSIVYTVGVTLMAILAIPTIGQRNLAGVVVALLIIAVGTGGIKPCVSSFGADQFVGKEEYIPLFFSMFYMSINAGSLLSMIISPLLKGITCLKPANETLCDIYSCDCYALAFGVPALLMVVAIVMFLAGSKLYIKNPPGGSIVEEFLKAISGALKNIIKKKTPPRRVTHWLDHAPEKFDRGILDDFKQLLSVMLVFSPLCFFWTLYDQTGSTWVIQGTQMLHKIGSWNITPDIIQAANPILVMIMIPVMDGFIYPFLTKRNILTKNLHRMVLGILFAALSFVVAGILQVAVVNDIRRQNSTDSSLLFDEHGPMIALRNQLSCRADIFQKPLRGAESLVVSIPEGSVIRMFQSEFKWAYVTSSCHEGKTHFEKMSELMSIQHNPFNINAAMIVVKGINTSPRRFWHSFQPRLTFRHGLTFSPRFVWSQTRAEQSSIPILWQLVQYFLLTCGEILFSVSGLSFAYAEAAPSLKSMMTAIWLLTNSVGNLITLIINSAAGDQSGNFYLFFVYAILMVVVDGLFVLLVKRYVPREKRIQEQKAHMGEAYSSMSDLDMDEVVGETD